MQFTFQSYLILMTYQLFYQNKLVSFQCCEFIMFVLRDFGKGWFLG